MFLQLVVVAGNVTVVEVGNPQIEKDEKEIGKVENGKIKTIFLRAGNILYLSVNPQNPERFYQQVQEQQKHQVLQKFLLHHTKINNC